MVFSIIGSGNIASWMAYAIHRSGARINQVYSRCGSHAALLADRYRADAIDDITRLNRESDAYIFTLSDDAYRVVLDGVNFKMNLAVHTSGSLPQDIFKDLAARYGVIYPYQSISADMDFSQLIVPLCIEADHDRTLLDLEQIAGSWSEKVYRVGGTDRSYLHLAAVFASNFVNALYGVGYEILETRNIDPGMMQPLLRNTLEKLDTMTPVRAQTGPAARGDDSIMKKHLGMLKEDDLKRIYRLMSSLIRERTEKNDTTDKDRE